MEIENLNTADLIPYARNARTHSDEQVAQIAGSIREFGFTNPVLIDADNGILAGHGRVMAAHKLHLQEVPCIRLTHLTDAQKRAYIIADNKLALNAGWDEEMLALELKDLEVLDFDLDLIGFDADELKNLFGSDIKTEEGLTDPDEVPEIQPEAKTQHGDIWILGNHRLMCGDSTNPEYVDRLMNNEKAGLCHADPPYGMGKEKDGIANDNLYGNKLDDFQLKWWGSFRKHLDDAASVYIWGNASELWRLWYKNGLADSERLTFRNEIVWDKKNAGAGGISHLGADGFRQYPNATERCLFFMLGEQGFNNNADNYWNGWESIRFYLETEMKKCGWTINDLNRITNTKMASHWVTKSQFCLITAEHYKKIQDEARRRDAFKREHDELKREHDELKRDHDELKRDFYNTRAFFDNTHDYMTDVWSFNRVTGDDRFCHATPKPVDMICRAIKSSLPQDGLCAEPFSGSGTTIIAAEKTGRRCYAMELSPQYVDVAVRRWQDFTGMEAVRESDGKIFNEV